MPVTGFEAGHIIPSRAFCSDENQGFPIILITKHFAAFPFNHGRVGGIVATGRHGPHADHGKDLVIIQAEFNRTFRTIVRSHQYQDNKLLVISCLTIDISPQEAQLFPLTKCVPRAAHTQDGNGSSRTLEQPEILELLKQQSIEKPDQIDMEAAIQQMVDAHEVRIML